MRRTRASTASASSVASASTRSAAADVVTVDDDGEQVIDAASIAPIDDSQKENILAAPNTSNTADRSSSNSLFSKYRFRSTGASAAADKADLTTSKVRHNHC